MLGLSLLSRQRMLRPIKGTLGARETLKKLLVSPGWFPLGAVPVQGAGRKAKGKRGAEGLLGAGLQDLCLSVCHTNWGDAKAAALRFTHPFPHLFSPASSPLLVAATTESFWALFPLGQHVCLQSCLC